MLLHVLARISRLLKKGVITIKRFLTAAFLAAMILLNLNSFHVHAAARSSSSAGSCIVIFIDGLSGRILDMQRITFGTAASPPAPPSHSGYVFRRWSTLSWTKVTSDMTISALYRTPGSSASNTSSGSSSASSSASDTARPQTGTENKSGSSSSGNHKAGASASGKSGSSSAKSGSSSKKYTVIFKDGVTGKVLKKQRVKSGGSAGAPRAPAHNGYRFKKWNRSFRKITSSTTVTALYTYHNGFVSSDGHRYYYLKGKKVKGAKKIDGDIYYFRKRDGALHGRILGITYIHQNTGVWKNKKWIHTSFPNQTTFNGYRLGSGACGITSCAMAISALRGKLTLPTAFNSPACGFNGAGSNWNVGVLSAKKYGLRGTVVPLSKKELISHLLKGHYVVVWVCNSIYGGRGNLNGGNTGSGGAHFVLIHGYRDGKFAIADPNNFSQSWIWSGKLNTWESFNAHLGNGRAGSYTVIRK